MDMHVLSDVLMTDRLCFDDVLTLCAHVCKQKNMRKTWTQMRDGSNTGMITANS